MTGLRDDVDTRPPAVAAVPHRDCPDEIRTCRLALTTAPPSLLVEWADGLVALLKTEIRHAARHGVISASECEQLSARLTVVIDQALSTG